MAMSVRPQPPPTRPRRRRSPPAASRREGDLRALPEAAGRAAAEPGPAQPDGQRAGDEPDGADPDRERHREAQSSLCRDFEAQFAQLQAAAGRCRWSAATSIVPGNMVRLADDATAQAGFELTRRADQVKLEVLDAERQACIDTIESRAPDQRPPQLRLGRRCDQRRSSTGIALPGHRRPARQASTARRRRWCTTGRRACSAPPTASSVLELVQLRTVAVRRGQGVHRFDHQDTGAS